MPPFAHLTAPHDIAPPATRPTRVRYAVMAFLGVLAFLTYFDRQCIARAQPDIKASLSISDQRMGLIMGAFWLAYALFELPGGWMGDRFGARRTLTRIVLAWSLFTALSGSAVGFLSLLCFRFLFGVGEAGAFPNMARVQSRWLPAASRGRSSGMLWLLARWGGAFSPLLFGLMTRGLDSPALRSWLGKLPGGGYLAAAESWRLAFFVSGLVGLVWVVAFYLWFRDDPADKATVNAAELELLGRGTPAEAEAGKAEAEGAKGHAMPAGGWRALLHCRSVWAMAVYYLCGSFGWSFFASWMPKYFNDVQKVSYEKSEWMDALPWLLGGISCLLGGALSQALIARTGWRRWGRAVFPLVGATTAAVAMALIPFVHTPTGATVLLCVASAAYDFGQAANWATILDLGGAYAGTTAGFVNMIGNLGNAFQPWIGPMIFHAVGWNALFGVYAAAFLVAASMWLMIDPRRTFYEDDKVTR